ncbi:MAG TPA: lipid-A-disaccharide synthase [Chlamydiales bacterium]|nr:lipid-A-disaccharide synthase [Chlamydiales bacterium]
MSPDLFISVGEPSGDLHGKELMLALQKLKPEIRMEGVFGPRMRELQSQSFGKMEDLSVMGFFDVLLHLPRIMAQFFKIRNQILKLNPKACVFIDYAEFHIFLEKSLRKKGYKGKLIHYICPSVWAWRKSRIKPMAENLDLLLALFPFEPACFSHTDLTVKYVGNPITKLLQPRVSKERNLIGIFPGSRQKEIQRNLPIQIQAAKELEQFYPDLHFEISCANNNMKALIESINTPLFPIQENSYDLMERASFAIATSGTVTLELALRMVPTVVTFAIKRWDQFLAQKILKINLPHYCIVNILAQKRVFPELFGTNLTLANLVAESKKLLSPNTILQECEKIKKLLTENDPAEKAASAILEILDS